MSDPLTPVDAGPILNAMMDTIAEVRAIQMFQSAEIEALVNLHLKLLQSLPTTKTTPEDCEAAFRAHAMEVLKRQLAQTAEKNLAFAGEVQKTLRKLGILPPRAEDTTNGIDG